MRVSFSVSGTVPLVMALFAGLTVATSPIDAAERPPARCIAHVAHPISTRVSALDPIARGAVVRLRVTAVSAVGLDRAEFRMTSTGGAGNRGPSSIALGTLAPGRAAQGVFTVAIPSSGGRQYVQFQVTGQGPLGRLNRGACYNLLPDGPAEAGRTVVTPEGVRVMEFGARRIDR